jgi:hypothetical protein
MRKAESGVGDAWRRARSHRRRAYRGARFAPIAYLALGQACGFLGVVQILEFLQDGTWVRRSVAPFARPPCPYPGDGRHRWFKMMSENALLLYFCNENKEVCGGNEGEAYKEVCGGNEGDAWLSRQGANPPPMDSPLHLHIPVLTILTCSQ